MPGPISGPDSDDLAQLEAAFSALEIQIARCRARRAAALALPRQDLAFSEPSQPSVIAGEMQRAPVQQSAPMAAPLAPLEPEAASQVTVGAAALSQTRSQPSVVAGAMRQAPVQQSDPMGVSLAPREPERRHYAVWNVPGRPEVSGVFTGSYPEVWHAVRLNLPNQRYTGSQARLHRAESEEEAIQMYLAEAWRHPRLPQTPPIHRIRSA